MTIDNYFEYLEGKLPKNLTFENWYNLVLHFRNDTKNEFPWPDRNWCLMYASQELGEVSDKLSRKLRPNDIRANDRDAEGVVEELADVAMMILSVTVNAHHPYVVSANSVSLKTVPLTHKKLRDISYNSTNENSLFKLYGWSLQSLGEALPSKDYLHPIQQTLDYLLLMAELIENMKPNEFFIVLCKRLYKRTRKIGWTDEQFVEMIENYYGEMINLNDIHNPSATRIKKQE